MNLNVDLKHPVFERMAKELDAEPPRFLLIVPCPDAQLSQCELTVEKQIALSGGSKVFGWDVEPSASGCLETEGHFVWKSVSGVLLDVTPWNKPRQRTVFMASHVPKVEPRGLFPASRGFALSHEFEPVEKFLNESGLLFSKVRESMVEVYGPPPFRYSKEDGRKFIQKAQEQLSIWNPAVEKAVLIRVGVE